MLQLAILLSAWFAPSGAALHAVPTSMHISRVVARNCLARAGLAQPEAAAAGSLLGTVLSVLADEGLVTIKPEARELAKVGTLLSFGGGATGVILSERCGLYFAATLDSAMPSVSQPAVLLPRNLTVAAWDVC